MLHLTEMVLFAIICNVSYSTEMSGISIKGKWSGLYWIWSTIGFVSICLSCTMSPSRRHCIRSTTLAVFLKSSDWKQQEAAECLTHFSELLICVILTYSITKVEVDSYGFFFLHWWPCKWEITCFAPQETDLLLFNASGWNAGAIRTSLEI